MRLLAALTAAACCLAAPAAAQESEPADPIGLLLEDPIGFLLEDRIALLLERPYDPARWDNPRAANVLDFDLDAQAIDVMGVFTGTPVAPPARIVRLPGLGPVELAARAFEVNYVPGRLEVGQPEHPLR